MADEERTIQVPASLARAIVGQLRTDAEQIDGEWGWGRTVAKIRESSDPDDYGKEGVRLSDELEALLSQPTPTAEPIDAVSASCVDGAAPEQQRETAAPPRPEDMAPGTTFTGRHADHWKRFEYDGAGRIRFVGGSGTWFLLTGPRGIRIDPSTIRDVTPPAVTT